MAADCALTFYDPRNLAQDNYVTFETDYGPARTQYWHGVDGELQHSTAERLDLPGRHQCTGRGVWDYCAVATQLPEMFGNTQFPPAGPAVRQSTGYCAVTEPMAHPIPGHSFVHHPEDRSPAEHWRSIEARHAGYQRQCLRHQRRCIVGKLPCAQLRDLLPRSVGCRPAVWRTARHRSTSCCLASCTATEVNQVDVRVGEGVEGQADAHAGGR